MNWLCWAGAVTDVPETFVLSIDSMQKVPTVAH